jgi:hypothetical protein
VWAIVIFDGEAVESGVALHARWCCATEELALKLDALRGGRDLLVLRRNTLEWMVGFRQLMLLPVEIQSRAQAEWVGLLWSAGRYAEPSVEWLESADEAAHWIVRHVGICSLDVGDTQISPRPRTGSAGLRATALRGNIHPCTSGRIESLIKEPTASCLRGSRP